VSFAFVTRGRIGFAAAALAAVFATAAIAQTPEELVNQRQAGMKELGAASKALNTMAKSGEINATEAVKAANTAAQHAKAMPNWFAKGTGADAGFKTKARAEIWSDTDAFSKAAQQLDAAASQISTAAQAGDKAGFTAGVDQFNGSCQSCHKAFRAS